ncbi:MAG TPA: LD-carboxypeptidase [Thermoanaerobaculia bacterium]|nr:LD-carboxypeptidase [Thermoanaerobaculia bacterium]
MAGLVRPPRLVPGDSVGVAALSGPPDSEALAAGVRALEGFGYRVKLAPNVLAKEPLLGLAGTSAERAAGYRALLLDPDVRAIVFARGGYGVASALRHLDPAEAARHPKIHCGFSDLTVLSSWLLKAGLPSFHGPMVAADLARGLDPLSASFFPAMLEGRGPREIFFEGEEGRGAPPSGPARGPVLLPGAASGRLVGGCLSLLAASVGTPWEFDYAGALLFFEDISEEAYRIDRMLGTLIDSGRFAKLSGILIGSLSAVTFGGVEDGARLAAVLEARLAPLGVPVALGLPAGHRGPNVTLPVGARTAWDGTGTLTFLEEIVA